MNSFFLTALRLLEPQGSGTKENTMNQPSLLTKTKRIESNDEGFRLKKPVKRFKSDSFNSKQGRWLEKKRGS